MPQPSDSTTTTNHKNTTHTNFNSTLDIHMQDIPILIPFILAQTST
ncbi:12817_t:CDS:2 [Acaulospora colombiana]|uniref:12817_t:CDS:1 n=1 Tax=Acaulospora colombiana TaxID=27376 RepID=A0ACA9L594_9GLOM|nr:12817_t:CDS:2 [Acaulospora colombiana]